MSEAESEGVWVSAAKILLELGLKAVEMNDIEQRLVRLEQLVKNNWKGGPDDSQSNSAQVGTTRRTNGGM
jgi:hypothetical protein